MIKYMCLNNTTSLTGGREVQKSCFHNIILSPSVLELSTDLSHHLSTGDRTLETYDTVSTSNPYPLIHSSSNNELHSGVVRTPKNRPPRNRQPSLLFESNVS